MNITRNIPNLIGGISQQPDQSRLANQCEEQVNYTSTPASGLSTRPPLKLVSATPYDGDGAFFILDRDADVKHNMWVSPDGIRVEDLDGNVQTVAYQDDALQYLSLPEDTDPRDSYRILPVADTCFIINRTKTTKVDPDSFTERKNQALIHIKQVAVSTTWSVNLDGEQVSFGYSSETNQSISTQEVATSLTTQLLAIPAISNNFNISTAASIIYIVRKDGGEFNIGLGDTRGNTYSSLTTYKIKDFTDLPTTAPDGFTCCISGTNGDSSDDYYVKFRGTGEIAPITWIDTHDEVESHEIVGYFDPNKINSYTPIKVGTQVSCTNVPSFKTTVKNVSYGRWTIITFADRFPRNPGNLTYAVKNSQNADNLVSGVWEECAAPDLPVAFDASTMPHVLYHDILNNTWTFRSVGWDVRVAGDAESAPFPSFINKPLTAIFLFRNRLGLIAGDSVSMSCAGDLENFFPDTVQTLADDHPIDIAVAVDDYSDILATCAVQDNLFFFSKKRQYTLATPEVLSPKTAAILPSTGYACLPDAGLPVCGSHIFFLDASGEFDQLYEYAVDTVSQTKEGLCVTGHVPSLISHQAPLILTASQSIGTAAVFSSATPDTIWLYQYYSTGKEKVQSAWSKHKFNGRIKNMGFRESVLWVEIKHDSDRLMCTLDLSNRPKRSSTDYTPVLDFQMEITNPQAEITLPYDPDNLVVLVPNAVGEYLPTKKYSRSGRRIIFQTAPEKVLVGESFTRTYIFSKQYPSLSTRQSSNIPLTNARFQLKRLKLNHYDTGYFIIRISNEVTGESRDYRVNPRLDFDSIFRAVMETRQTNIPCRGRNTEIIMSIISDSFTPETFLSADIEMNYINKTRII